MTNNNTLNTLSITLTDLIDAYLDDGKINRAELIGMLELIKLGYFHEILEEDEDAGQSTEEEQN